MSRVIDLSVPTGPGPGEPIGPQIEYQDHASAGWYRVAAIVP